MKRVLFDIALLLAVFIVPWWAALIVALAGIFLFDDFYEAVGAGMLMYALYGVGSSGALASRLWLPVILIGVFFLLTILKKRIIKYSKCW